MTARLLELGGVRVLLAASDGPPLRSDRDALDLLSQCYEQEAGWLALPVSRCGAEFFRLRTRILGNVAQKAVNYGVRLAIVGDVSAHVAASDALRDLVREANRGRQLCFVADLGDLRERLVRPH